MSDEELINALDKGSIRYQKLSKALIEALDAYVGEPIILTKKNMKENFLTVITYYSPDDKEFMEDYHSIEIVDSTGVIVTSYGDHYHDNGQERAQGFIEGVLWVYPQYRDRIGYIQKNQDGLD